MSDPDPRAPGYGPPDEAAGGAGSRWPPPAPPPGPTGPDPTAPGAPGAPAYGTPADDPTAYGTSGYGYGTPGYGYGTPGYGYATPGYGTPAPSPYGYGYGYGTPGPRNEPLAVAAMTCSIVGAVLQLCCIAAVPLPIVGLVLGIVARRRINEAQGALTGSGMATAGIVVGIVGVGLFALVLLLNVAVFSLGAF